MGASPSSNGPGHFRELAIGFDEALARLPEALKKEGFGVISDIDMQQTLKAKLGVDVPRYRIVGACSPGFAHAALQADLRVGLLLPCNLVVYEREDGRAVLGAVDPTASLAAAGTAGLDDIAREVGARLSRVLDAVSA